MGLLNPLYDAVSWIIVQFHALFSPLFGTDSGWSWGLAIVFLVVVVRIGLIPLFVKQIKATRNMQVLQPRMKEIQQKHKDNRERQAQEMMKLYKETGTNPLSSCLPLLIQAPFLIALYQVLNGIATGHVRGVLTPELVQSAAQANLVGASISEKFLGNSSLTVKLVTVTMIVFMSLTQFITQRQLMVKNVPVDSGPNPFVQQQKVLLYVLPGIFAVTGVNFPVGVLLYFLTTNLWSMGQQLFVIRRMPAPGSLAEKRLHERRAGKLDQQNPHSVNESLAASSSRSPIRRQQPTRQSRSERTSRRKLSE